MKQIVVQRVTVPNTGLEVLDVEDWVRLVGVERFNERLNVVTLTWEVAAPSATEFDVIDEEE